MEAGRPLSSTKSLMLPKLRLETTEDVVGKSGVCESFSLPALLNHLRLGDLDPAKDGVRVKHKSSSWPGTTSMPSRVSKDAFRLSGSSFSKVTEAFRPRSSLADFLS